MKLFIFIALMVCNVTTLSAQNDVSNIVTSDTTNNNTVVTEAQLPTCEWRDAVTTVAEVAEPNEKEEKQGDDYDNAFDGWYNTRSSATSLLTILASLVTVIGFITVVITMRQGMVSRKCQARIIIDLIRHFVVNSAIVDGVLYKLRYEGMKPEEGVFMRLATLESDMNLERFIIDASNYESIHNISLSMRNYNQYVNIVEEHFKHAHKGNINELCIEVNNIRSRLNDIVAKLWVFQVEHGHRISAETPINFIINNYGNDANQILDNELTKLTDVNNPFMLKDKYKKRIENFKGNLWRRICDAVKDIFGKKIPDYDFNKTLLDEFDQFYKKYIICKMKGLRYIYLK